MKISHKKYLEFRRDFYTTDMCEHLRLGQAFLNQFFPSVSDAELYYSTNATRSETMIYERYVLVIDEY